MNRAQLILGIPLIVLCFSSLAAASQQTPPETASPNAPAKVKLENLLSAELERLEGTEVIVSRVTVPPNTALPKHWHPGEEFGYVIEGVVVLWQEGKDEIIAKGGDVVRIPLKQIHTAITREEGATLLVFRVHEKGQPERILVE